MADYTNEPLKFTVDFDLKEALNKIDSLQQSIGNIKNDLSKEKYKLTIDDKQAINSIKNIIDLLENYKNVVGKINTEPIVSSEQTIESSQNIDKVSKDIKVKIGSSIAYINTLAKSFKDKFEQFSQIKGGFNQFKEEGKSSFESLLLSLNQFTDYFDQIANKPLIDKKEVEESEKSIEKVTNVVGGGFIQTLLKVGSVASFVFKNFEHFNKIISLFKKFRSQGEGVFSSLTKAIKETISSMGPFKSIFSILEKGLKAFSSRFKELKQSEGTIKSLKGGFKEFSQEIKNNNKAISLMTSGLSKTTDTMKSLLSQTNLMNALTRKYRSNSAAVGTLVPKIFKNIDKATKDSNNELSKTDKNLKTIKKSSQDLKNTDKIFNDLNKSLDRTNRLLSKLIKELKALPQNINIKADTTQFKKGEKYIRNVKKEFEHSIHVPAYIKFDKWFKDEKKLRSYINDAEKFKVEIDTQLDHKTIKQLEKTSKQAFKNIDKLGQEDIRMFAAMNRSIRQLEKEGRKDLGNLSKSLGNLNAKISMSGSANKKLVGEYSSLYDNMGATALAATKLGVNISSVSEATMKLAGVSRVMHGDIGALSEGWEGLVTLWKSVPGWIKAVVASIYLAIKAFTKFIEIAQEGIKNLGKFQTGMDELRAVMNEPAESQFLDELENKVLQISTKLGAAFEDVQSWMKRLAEADIGAENIEAYTEAVGKLERTGVANAEAGIRALYQVTRVWGDETRNADQILGLMINTANEVGGSFNTLSSTIENIIPAARELGVSFEDTLGIMQFFSNQGFTLAESSQMVRSIFEKIADPEIRNRLEQLGIPFRNMNQFVRDLAQNQDVIGELFSESEEEAERFNVTYTRTFDKFSASQSIANNQVNESLVGMRNLTNETDLFNETLQSIRSTESLNALNTEYENFGDNIEFVQDRINAAWERTTLSLATQLEPVKETIQELNLRIVETLDDLISGTKDFEDVIPILGESIQDTIDTVVVSFEWAIEAAQSLYKTFEFAVESWRNFVDWWQEPADYPEWLTGLMDFFYSFSFILDAPLQQIKTIFELLGEATAYLNDFLYDTNHVIEDLNESLLEQNEALKPQKDQLDEINKAWFNLSEAIESGKSFEEALGEVPELPEDFVDRLRLIASTTKDVGQQQEVLNRAFQEYLDEQTRFVQIDLLSKLKDQFDLISQYADEVEGIFDVDEEANVQVAIEYIGREENQAIMQDLESLYGFRYEEAQLISKQNVDLAEMLSIEQELREMNRTGNTDIEKRTNLLERQRTLAENLVNVQSQFDDIAQNMHEGLIDVNDVYTLLNKSGMRQKDIVASINAIMNRQRQLRREEHENLADIYQLDVDIIDKLSDMNNVYYEMQQRSGRVAQSEQARYNAVVATLKQLQTSPLIEQMGRQFNILQRYAEEMINAGAEGGEEIMRRLQSVAIEMVRNQDWEGAAREVEDIVANLGIAGNVEGDIANQLVENLRLIGELMQAGRNSMQEYKQAAADIQEEQTDSLQDNISDQQELTQKRYEHEAGLLKELYDQKKAYAERYQNYELNQIENRYQKEIDEAINSYNERINLLEQLNTYYAQGTANNIQQVISEIRQDNNELADQLVDMVEDFATQMGVSFENVDFSSMVSSLSQDFGRELSRELSPVFRNFSNDFETSYNTVIRNIRNTSESAASSFENSVNSFIDGLEGVDRQISDDIQNRIDTFILAFANGTREISSITDETLRTSLENAQSEIANQREQIISLAQEYGMTLRDENGQAILDIQDDWINFYNTLGSEQTQQLKDYITNLYSGTAGLREDLFGEAILDYVQRSLEDQEKSIEDQNEVLEETESLYQEQIDRINEMIDKENDVSNSISEQNSLLRASAEELDTIVGYTDEEKSIIEQIKNDVETLNGLYIEGKLTQTEYNDLLEKEDELRKKLESNLRKRNELELERLEIQYEQENIAFSQNEYERKRSQILSNLESDLLEIAELQQSIATPEISTSGNSFYGQLGALPAQSEQIQNVEFDLSASLENAFDNLGSSIKDLSDYTRESRVDFQELEDFSVAMTNSITSFDGDVYELGSLVNRQVNHLNTNSQEIIENTNAIQGLTQSIDENTNGDTNAESQESVYAMNDTLGTGFENIKAGIDHFSDIIISLEGAFSSFVDQIKQREDELETYMQSTEVARSRTLPESTRGNQSTEAQIELAEAVQEATDTQLDIAQDIMDILTSRDSGITMNDRSLSGIEVIDELKDALSNMGYTNAIGKNAIEISELLEQLHQDEESTQELIENLINETAEDRRLRIQGRIDTEQGDINAEITTMQTGGLTLEEGLAYLHSDELIIPAGGNAQNDLDSILSIVRKIETGIEGQLTQEGSELRRYTIEIEGLQERLSGASETERQRILLSVNKLREEQSQLMQEIYNTQLNLDYAQAIALEQDEEKRKELERQKAIYDTIISLNETANKYGWDSAHLQEEIQQEVQRINAGYKDEEESLQNIRRISLEINRDINERIEALKAEIEKNDLILSGASDYEIQIAEINRELDQNVSQLMTEKDTFSDIYDILNQGNQALTKLNSQQLEFLKQRGVLSNEQIEILDIYTNDAEELTDIQRDQLDLTEEQLSALSDMPGKYDAAIELERELAEQRRELANETMEPFDWESFLEIDPDLLYKTGRFFNELLPGLVNNMAQQLASDFGQALSKAIAGDEVTYREIGQTIGGAISSGIQGIAAATGNPFVAMGASLISPLIESGLSKAGEAIDNLFGRDAAIRERELQERFEWLTRELARQEKIIARMADTWDAMAQMYARRLEQIGNDFDSASDKLELLFEEVGKFREFFDVQGMSIDDRITKIFELQTEIARTNSEIAQNEINLMKYGDKMYENAVKANEIELANLQSELDIQEQALEYQEKRKKLELEITKEKYKQLQLEEELTDVTTESVSKQLSESYKLLTIAITDELGSDEINARLKTFTEDLKAALEAGLISDEEYANYQSQILGLADSYTQSVDELEAQSYRLRTSTSEAMAEIFKTAGGEVSAFYINAIKEGIETGTYQLPGVDEIFTFDLDEMLAQIRQLREMGTPDLLGPERDAYIQETENIINAFRDYAENYSALIDTNEELNDKAEQAFDTELLDKAFTASYDELLIGRFNALERRIQEQRNLLAIAEKAGNEEEAAQIQEQIVSLLQDQIDLIGERGDDASSLIGFMEQQGRLEEDIYEWINKRLGLELELTAEQEKQTEELEKQNDEMGQMSEKLRNLLKQRQNLELQAVEIGWSPSLLNQWEMLTGEIAQEMEDLGYEANVIADERSRIGSIPHFQEGGHVPYDTLAMLHEGEYVIPKNMVDFIRNFDIKPIKYETVNNMTSVSINNNFQIDSIVDENRMRDLLENEATNIVQNGLRQKGLSFNAIS